MANNRIGILGGTFNPVHHGHLILAQDAMEIFELDRVLFVPCDKPPHKDSATIISATHRIAMLQAAFQGNPAFEVCDLELRRGGTTYTVDTMRELTRLYANSELVFIIGSDTLPELHLWKEIGELLNLCRFVTLARPGFDLKSISAAKLHLPPPWPQKLLSQIAKGHTAEISASDIRHRVAEEMSIRYLVPTPVELYIAENDLYKG
jgi:nicotinate-nucleotide adenylyltransferase